MILSLIQDATVQPVVPFTVKVILFFVAAATAFTWAERRYSAVRDFKRELRLAFSLKMEHGPGMDPEARIALAKTFRDSLPGGLQLFFSRHPLYKEHWFQPQQLELFFNPTFQPNL